MRRVRRAAVLAVYFAAFWILLPYGLWLVAGNVESAFGWSGRPLAVGIPVAAAGAALLASGLFVLWRGGALPATAFPPAALVRRGPYRRVRHPVYLGFNLALFGVGLWIGSPGLAWVVAPAFFPVWVGYASLEERALVRRFGESFRRYQRQVGLLPRFGLYRLSQALMALGLIPVRVEGRENVPIRGPAILVHNHASYLDPAFVGMATHRPVHFLTTAEAYRKGFKRWVVTHFCNVPVRRYRTDTVACREMIRLLGEGEIVGDAIEGERTPDGRYQGALPRTARVLRRIPVPVIPVGISGAYDTGPRWSDLVRRRAVKVSVGRPIEWEDCDPGQTVDRALLTLVEEDPQPVDLEGLPVAKLARVLWRCPECGEEEEWSAGDLHCRRCSAIYRPTEGGWLRGPGGQALSLGDLSRAVTALPELPVLSARAWALKEASMFGTIRPLEPRGEGILVLDSEALRFGDLELSLAAVRSTTTERADTLQVATREDLWQFRLLEGSAFRFHRAVDLRRGAETGGASVASRGPSRRLARLFGGGSVTKADR